MKVKLKELLDQRGMSIEELAVKKMALNYNDDLSFCIESLYDVRDNGSHGYVDISDFETLCKALNCSISDLLEFE
jgi:DNA-binding Xre family transcriptional regulator